MLISADKFYLDLMCANRNLFGQNNCRSVLNGNFGSVYRQNNTFRVRLGIKAYQTVFHAELGSMKSTLNNVHTQICLFAVTVNRNLLRAHLGPIVSCDHVRRHIIWSFPIQNTDHVHIKSKLLYACTIFGSYLFFGHFGVYNRIYEQRNSHSQNYKYQRNYTGYFHLMRKAFDISL